MCVFRLFILCRWIHSLTFEMVEQNRNNQKYHDSWQLLHEMHYLLFVERFNSTEMTFYVGLTVSYCGTIAAPAVQKNSRMSKGAERERERVYWGKKMNRECNVTKIFSRLCTLYIIKIERSKWWLKTCCDHVKNVWIYVCLANYATQIIIHFGAVSSVFPHWWSWK